MAKDSKLNLVIQLNGKEVADTLQGVGREVGRLKKEINNLTPGTEEFVKKSEELAKARDRYGEIKNEIDGTNNSLEEAKGSFKTLFQGILSGDMNAVKTGLMGVQGSIVGATKASLAFIATPLGAVLAAISLVVGALVSYLTSTQEGIDKVTSVTRPLMAIMESLKGVLQNVGKALFDVFSKPKESAQELYDFIKDKVVRVFDGYMKILSGIATLDFDKAKEGLSDITDVAKEGIDAIKGAVSDTFEFFEEAAKKGAEIDRLQKEIEKSQLAYNEQVIATGDLLEEQELISRDTSRSMKERAAAAQEQIRLTAELGKMEAGILEMKIAQMEIQHSLNDTSRADEQELIDLKVQLDAANDRGHDAEVEQMRVMAKMRKEEQAEAKKRSDAIKSEAAAKLKVFETAEKELNQLLKDQQQERDNNALSAEAREMALIDQKYQKLREKFTLSEQQKTELTKEQVIERENQLAALDEQLALEKEERIIARNAAFKERLDEIEAENRTLDDEARFEREIAEAESDDEKALILLEKTRYLAEQQLNIALDKELAELDGVENAETLKQAIREKFSKKQAQVEAAFAKGKADADKAELERQKQLTKERTQAYSDMFGNIAELLGKNTVAGKAAAIAQATINTYQGITEVWTTKSVLPEPFATISRIASTGMVLASGLSAVGSIKSTQTPSFFYGGHTGDKAIHYDQYGKVTGFVHEKEWVAPRFMTENPRYASTFKWLEKDRLKGLGKGYFDGGSTSTAPPAFMDDDSTDTADVNTILAQLGVTLDLLYKLLESGVTTGPIVIGDDELQNIDKRILSIKNARESAKIP